MKRLFCDGRHVWEVTPVSGDEESHIISENNPYTVTDEDNTFDLHSVDRYWHRRTEFWPNFADGICTDIEGLFSVTPWDAACEIAQTLDKFFAGDAPLILDACCGVGGNTIAFSKCLPSCQAIGIDTDPTRLVCAKHNSEVFGVTNIDFVRQDAIEFINSLPAGSARFVFSSPPWGGPGYVTERLEDIPFDLFALANAACHVCAGGFGRLALFLPRFFPVDQAKRLASRGEKMACFRVTTGPKKRVIAMCFVYDKMRPKQFNV